jgi:hypothetical protein
VVTAKVALELPALAVIAAGETVMPKSCSERTVKAKLRECVKPAEVPVAVTAKVPLDIVTAMERTKVCLLPVGTLNGEAGDVVTPAGNPERVIVTGSGNPFCPTIDMVNVEVESPASAVIVAGDSVMLKSLAGDCEGGDGAGPLPQPTKLPTQSQIQTAIPTLTRVVGGQHARVVRVPNCC